MVKGYFIEFYKEKKKKRIKVKIEKDSNQT